MPTDYILITSYLVLLLGSIYGGYSSLLELYNLTSKTLKQGIGILVTFIATGAAVFFFDLLDPVLARKITKGIYIIAGGFFLGNAFRLWEYAYNAGAPEYKNPSFISLFFPYLIAMVIILFGFYRLSIFTKDELFTLENISGLSLVAFGAYAWSLHLTPEFRSNGILILDQYIGWESFVTFNLDSEHILCLEYYDEQEKICEIKTEIPPEDIKKVVTIIEKHMMDKLNEEHF